MSRTSDELHGPLLFPSCGEVASLLDGRKRRALNRPRRAAVLIPLVQDGGPLRLILTRRTEDLSTHKGQVSFPGGGMEPEDRGPVDAALREAEEEIGLCRERVQVLGLLDDFPTITDEMAVTPVVGKVDDASGLTAAPDEVARIFFLPLDLLQDGRRWVIRSHRRFGRTWPVYFFEHDGEILWGLSAYITLHWMQVCGLGAPFELPDAPIE